VSQIWPQSWPEILAAGVVGGLFLLACLKDLRHWWADGELRQREQGWTQAMRTVHGLHVWQATDKKPLYYRCSKCGQPRDPMGYNSDEPCPGATVSPSVTEE
jgi:hypothetical protein